MVSACPPIFDSSIPFNKHKGTILSLPIISGITVTVVIHNFFSSLAKSKYFSLLSFPFRYAQFF